MATYSLPVNRDDVRKVLKRARGLLKLGWTKGTAARNRYGHEVRVNCENATKFCAVGAIGRAAGKNYKLASETERFLNSVLSERGVSVIGFNDAPTRTRDEVLDLFSRGISYLQ